MSPVSPPQHAASAPGLASVRDIAGQTPQSRIPGFAGPVEVKVHPDAGRPVRTVRVAAVVPCFNRRADAEALLGDLAGLDTSGMDLRILLVDNASDVPLSDIVSPDGLRLDHLRLASNTGGSGGYNAGMRSVLGLDGADRAWLDFDPDCVWLVDSDARVAPSTLRALVDVIEHDPDIVAAGSALADPLTGQFFELGGHVNRRNGNYEPHVTGNAGVRAIVECDYLAACCALVRADAIRCAGVFPDTFLNGDDVEWFIRMGQRTGGRIVAVPWSCAMHPRFDRFPTWTRYYMTRNAFGPLDAVGGGARLRLRRAAVEVPRAVQQEMMGRPDLARLHLLGLEHAAQGQTHAIAPPGTISVEPTLPLRRLAERLSAEPDVRAGVEAIIHPRLLIDDDDRAVILEQLRLAGLIVHELGAGAALAPRVVGSTLGALGRWLRGPRVAVAVVPSRGRPDGWLLGKLSVHVTPGGFLLRRSGRFIAPLRAARALCLGSWRAVQIGARRPGGPSLLDPAYAAAKAFRGGTMSVEAVVLSHNRWPALERTLSTLSAMSVFNHPGAERTITVVDNHSTDGTADRVAEFFPRVRLLRMERNEGVEAFNRAAEKSTADAVLILDDDAIPEENALCVAIDALARRPGLGAVTLHPRHPATGAGEWPAAQRTGGKARDDWPLMGCANLVRRSAWNAVGGYEKKFFLYRNDADLALKLLGAGWGVRFDPALIAWHDSPAGPGAAKSLRWHDLATRNWVWMCRRHGRGIDAIGGALLGWAWAHRLAGLSLSRHRATLRGALAGLSTPPPPLPAACDAAGVDEGRLRRLLGLQLRRGSDRRARGGGGGVEAEPARRPAAV